MHWLKRRKQALSADELLSQLQDDQQLTFAQFAVIVKPFSTRDSHECTMAFRILHTINANLKETQSWPFQLLKHCDLEHVTGKTSWLDRLRKRPSKLASTEVGSSKSAFNINIASKVHKQCLQMKTQMQQWDIKHLQNVTGKLLTNGSFTSDASSVLITLVLRILSRYSELEEKLDVAMSRATLVKINYELTEKLGRELENGGEVDGEEGQVNPLLVAYRSFVKQLLSELDSESDNKQELLQVVRDLEDMYKQYAADSPKKSPRKRTSSSKLPFPSTPRREDESADPFDYMDSPTHTQTESFSSMTNSVNSLFSSASKASSSVSEELPNLLHAFDVEYIKQQRQRREVEGYGLSSPQSMASSMSSKSLSSSKSFSKLNNSNHAHLSPLVSSSPMQQPHAPVSVTRAAPVPSHLDVQMINNRMMVKTASGYQDMQEWVIKQNQEAALHAQPAAPKTASDYIVTVPKHTLQSPATGSSFLSNIFGHKPLTPPVPLERKDTTIPKGPTTSMLAKSLSARHSAFESSYRQEMNDFE